MDSSTSNPPPRSEQEQRRRDERKALEHRGIDPYPYEWPTDAHAADLIDTFLDAMRDYLSTRPDHVTLHVERDRPDPAAE